MPSIHEFNFKDINGEAVEGKRYRGRVLLIVNVASRCGFTPQYEGLEKLNERYRERGLSVIGFPCNDFGGQEPGGEAQIAEFCERRFGVHFDMMGKVAIRGGEADPLFRYLESVALPAESGGTLKARLFRLFKRLYYLLRGKRLPARHQVSWNFHKFLIDRAGRPVAHFSSTVEPGDPALLRRIEAELETP